MINQFMYILALILTNPYLYFLFLSILANTWLPIMWILLESKGYKIYLYDRILFFLMMEDFIYKTVFIAEILIWPLNFVCIWSCIYTWYFIIYLIKGKGK